jgi:GNAT superfamily N-acetyltransferase
MSFAVRPATLDDVPAAARLLNAADDDRVMTAEGMLHFVRTVPERARRTLWGAEADGELVAWGNAGLNWESANEGDCYANLIVDRGHRRRGIGAAMWERIDEHLGTIGAVRVSVFGKDEPDAHRFAAARGFRETFRLRTSRLELDTLPPPPAAPDGVELRSLGAYADDPRPIFELDNEVSKDIPLDQPLGDGDFDEWLDRYWRHPMVDREASVVAVVGGEPVCFTMLTTAPETGRAMTGMTGTRRDHRGRGLAELVKRHSLARAAEAGITVAFTENDETNAPMLAVNDRIGYRPSSTHVTFSRP